LLNFKAFRIISSSDETYKKTAAKLIEFMSEYIVKDEIRTDSARLLTEKEVYSIVNFTFNSDFAIQ
jgi:hypothetical protein